MNLVKKVSFIFVTNFRVMLHGNNNTLTLSDAKVDKISDILSMPKGKMT